MDYGLIGEKLGHSYSKEIHEKLAGYNYEITPLTREEFVPFMEQHNFKAINVTIPYKRDVIPYLDELDENAKRIGAVNTIVNKNGKLIGHNTDFSGFLYMISHNRIIIEGKKVLLIGNGGAAQAIAAVIRHQKARELVIVDIKSGDGAISYDECYDSHLDSQIIINTSPVGMYPNIDNSPIDVSLFRECEAVLDAVYNPLHTKFSMQANALEIKAVTGLEMLVAQAKYAVEYFLDERIEDSVIDLIYKEIRHKIIEADNS